MNICPNPPESPESGDNEGNAHDASRKGEEVSQM